jgi:hypothetical protein
MWPESATILPHFVSPQLPNGWLQRAHFLVSRSLAFACNNLARFKAMITAARVQFASAQRCFRKGKGGMREHAILKENSNQDI